MDAALDASLVSRATVTAEVGVGAGAGVGVGTALPENAKVVPPHSHCKGPLPHHARAEQRHLVVWERTIDNEESVPSNNEGSTAHACA